MIISLGFDRVKFYRNSVKFDYTGILLIINLVRAIPKVPLSFFCVLLMTFAVQLYRLFLSFHFLWYVSSLEFNIGASLGTICVSYGALVSVWVELRRG